MTPGTVYVIQSGEYYKIGRTGNLAQRLAGLQAAHPAPSTVCYQLETPASETLERYLHQRFQAVRVRGEWFMLAAADVDWIRSIQQWTQDDAERLRVTVRKPQARTILPPAPGTLVYLLDAHGIPTIAEFRRRTGLSKQHAWNLWHGRANVGVHLARRLAERLDIPYVTFLELERERPPAPRPPGRPRKRPSSATPPKDRQP